ncbi:hypothetical protein M407DRAFT_11911 [Tulasnella calospora MUT 4182]|uniref:Uncharacterized protein n=1 Tax=Tulasnella calospora MUT 4182 TaxID=1051891 RepID=A0A0C3LAC5_9AGAM|nr:hypothetical protein M407DRAFT_12211 [Tulasnella calospora MUT 4182]KIO18377.1 hypothetical protein M407DRAFT_11911 [Tulasnella calospora MUT 4182]
MSNACTYINYRLIHHSSSRYFCYFPHFSSSSHVPELDPGLTLTLTTCGDFQAGWKVTQPIIWSPKSNTNGGDINRLWFQPNNRIRLHDRNRFKEKQFAEVSLTLQPRLQRLYQYLMTTAAPMRRGTASGNISRTQKANGSYIWKVFRQQAFDLWKDEQEELIDDNAMLELRELLDDLAKNRKICSKVVGKLGIEGKDATQMENPPKASSSFKKSIESLNRFDGMSSLEMSHEMKYSVHDPTRIPTSPLDQFRPVEADDPYDRKRGRESSSEPEDDVDQVELRYQTLSRKRFRCSTDSEYSDSTAEARSNQVREVESSTATDPELEPAFGADLIEALVAECKDPASLVHTWTSSQLLMKVVSMGRSPPEQLRKAIIDGMWDAPEVIKENEDLGTPFNDAIAKALRNLDEAVILL